MMKMENSKIRYIDGKVEILLLISIYQLGIIIHRII